MILNVRGGSGAGKSTIIKKIMAMFGNKQPHFVEGRKQPLWYDCWNDLSRAPLLRVLGHYEIECGGCDTISKNTSNPEETAMDYIHRLVREAHDEGMNVLYEGVILSTVNGHLLKMVEDKLPIEVINLTTDLETCLLGISDRRQRKQGVQTIAEVRASLEPVTIKNNVGKLKSATKTAHQLKVKGANVHNCDRESAVTTIQRLLEIQ